MKMNAVILAGGMGTRLLPITSDIPKPLVPINGKPCMSYIIELLAENGINDAVVTLHYLGDRITEYYGPEYHGVKLHYFTEPYPLGTAGSVKSAEMRLDDTFLVISGDAMCRIDLRSAISFHEKVGADVTMVLKETNETEKYGIAVCNKEGRIERFEEKPKNSFSNKANTGIYVINKNVLDIVPQGKKYDFGKDLFPKMLSLKMKLYGYVTDKYWCDIGSIDEFYKSNMSHEKERAVCGNGCSISGSSDVRNSVIFDGVEIGSGAVVDGAIVCGGVKIDDGVRVPRGCIIKSGEHVDRNYDFSGSIDKTLLREVENGTSFI